jgi:hypothetical protein
MKCLLAVGVLAATIMSSNPLAAGGPPVDIATRARGAASVMVATVSQVSASFQRNRFGDQLIVSRLYLTVDETMKGKGRGLVSMDLEGGTVGDLTLKVSDLPSQKSGDRAVFFLDGADGDVQQPHLRGLGILKLDGSDHVVGSDLSLSQIRTMVHASR